ncbi:carbohydrate-binding module family 18 [Xylaria sp. CBS 124048]|nr:carbohydrate-binding module family 18 [Xylaria sp. CBS 124048]
MRLPGLASLVLCAGDAIAHNADLNGYPIPKLVGARKFLRDIRHEGRWEQSITAPRGRRHGASDLEERGDLEERQNTSGQCGPGFGSCAAGYCCSFAGWCGQGADYCSAPDCQINYGPACDGNQKPTGADTSKIARPKIGSIPYGGVGITDCINNNQIALTFDDGPYSYTNDLLDKLAKYNAKATFFITGNNLHKGKINDPSTPWPAVIKRMAAEGHQIGSHTWSHQNYSQLTTTQFQNQIYWNEIAFNDILGYFPTYMRPPYSICPTKSCGAQLANLGYHVTYFDLDTEGYLHDDPTQIQTSKNIWDQAVQGTDPCITDYLLIEHDIHYQTVYNLTDYILASLFTHGYTAVTVGQCLGDPAQNWYRAGSKPVPSYTFTTRPATGTWSCLAGSTSTSTSASTATSSSGGTKPTGTLQPSVDGTCGNGFTCDGSAYGNCCSQYGFCGSSDDYCLAGCQTKFGSGCKVVASPSST